MPALSGAHVYVSALMDGTRRNVSAADVGTKVHGSMPAASYYYYLKLSAHADGARMIASAVIDGTRKNASGLRDGTRRNASALRDGTRRNESAVMDGSRNKHEYAFMLGAVCCSIWIDRIVKVSRRQSIKAPRYQGTKVSRHQGIKAPRWAA
jgi:hypothetical protein